METTATVLGPKLVLHRVTDRAVLSRVHATMRDLANDGSARARYPGPNPVSLEASRLPGLSAQTYVVCEKTDGVRYALVCCTCTLGNAAAGGKPGRQPGRQPGGQPGGQPGRQPGGQPGGQVNVCALVDRALTVYLLPLAHVPRAMFQGTLMDGELVRNKVTGAWEYLVFDAVCISGVPVLEGTLEARMDGVRRALAVYRASPGDPVLVRAKSFYSSFDQFEQHLALIGANYEVDGLILTPAAPPVVYGRHMDMFKVKLSNRHTIDFLVGGDGVSLRVFDAGAHTAVGTLASAATPGTIVECSLVGGDTWAVVGVRTDKTTANDMFTFQKTMLNIRENLSVDDVKRAWRSV